MARRPKFERSASDIRPGRVDGWGVCDAEIAKLAAAATLGFSGKHKDYPAPNGEWVPVHRRGTARCERYRASEWPKMAGLLRKAICLGIVQLESGERFPVRVWAFANGTLHEARITNRTTGEYHAFPLEHESQWPSDPYDLLKVAPREQFLFD